ncbi:MAG TPA: FG-GAP-like repeat-containing protein, partial [Pyrinomonadaceae bacterium]|nr:FG-GAP-like repeat-containing protein [Pyrinomonadaceae bacterium]
DGEAVRVSSGTAYLRNTIVRAVNPSLADMSGTIVSLGNNLVGKNVGISTAFPAGNPNVNGDIVGSANSIVNPQLHTLANNGGQTDTSASFPNSPAIDRGNACVVTAACSQHNPPAALNTDQRGTGFLRMFNNFVDIGAYESTDVPAPIITSLSSPTRGAGTGSFQLTVFGSGFTAGVLGSVVRWQGQDRATTFISPTELRATILASDVQSVGQFEVRVFNAVPSGGGNDSWVLLTVVNCQISSPASAVNLSSGGGSVAAPVATAGGCGWTGTANAAWITDLTPGGAGAGTASFNVLPNPGPARMAVVTLALPSNGMAFQITVAQASGCTYTLSPISRSINSAANSGDLSMNAGSGCTWTALSSASWISVTAGSAGNGNGTISYTVQSNPTPLSRTATITAGGQTFTLTQSGTTMSVGDCSIVEGNSGTANCYFRVSLSAASAQTVSFTYVTVSRSATADEDFVHTSGFASIPPGQTFLDLGVPVIGDIVVEGNETFGVVLTFPSNASVVGPEGRGTIINDDQVRRARADFDGDGKTDIGIFRGSGGEWWINRSSNGSTFALQFGAPTDRIVPGDFTGDGKADIAFWRPSTGEWYVLRSENNSFFAFPFGTNGDIPVPADYDGDGKTDAAVFRPSTATWFISNSFGGTTITQFGAAGDQPVPADYDDDGHADIAIYRPSLGQWWLNRSTAGVTALTFGTNTDKAVPADYTGDGKADVAFWRPSTGEWFVLRSENQSYYAVPFGTNGDKPAPGDYDGDGKADLTIFRPSSATWYVQRTTAGTLIQQFGANGDQPTANAFVP